VTCYEDRAYQFIIEGALDVDGPYTMIVDRTRNRLEGALATPIINTIDSIEARYVRITVMSADVYTGQWVSLTELRVFGEGERTFSTSTNELEENTITLTPNPASTIINIQGGEAYNRVTIFDQSGKRVFQSDISRSGTFDVSELQSGIYLVTLESNDKRHVVKMVKQ
jgi:hypothetical protein